MENIQELIDKLEEIKKEHGNLKIMGEYDATYYFGCDIEVRLEKNPDDYLGDKIKVLFVS